MVGVPGRSRACRPCRQRKKGCDLTQPTCNRCRKAKIQCHYDEHRNFVMAPARPATPDSLSGTIQVLTIDPAAKDGAREDSNSPDLGALPQNLHKSAYHDLHYQLAWDVLLPGGKPSPACQARYPLNSWIFVAGRLYKEHAALRKSVAAVTLSGLGRRDGNAELMKVGLKLYIEALGEVRKDILAIKAHNSAALIVAARVLASFEILYGGESEQIRGLSQVNSWHGHNLGEVAILRSRPATAFANGHDHQIFVDGRMQLTIIACTTRKRTFLDDPVWRTAPWATEPRSSRDLLIDVMIQIPAILEDYDTLKREFISGNARDDLGNEGHQASCHKLLRECSRLEGEFDSLWRDHAPLSSYETLRLRGFEHPTTDELVSTHFRTVYWTGCVYLYTTMGMLRVMAAQAGGGSADKRPPGGVSEQGGKDDFKNMGSASRSDPSTTSTTGSFSDSTTARGRLETDVHDATSTLVSTPMGPQDVYTYCHRITEALEAFFQPEAGTFGAYSSPFPLGVCFGHLMAEGGDKGLGSLAWNKTISYFGRGEVGRALELFLMGHVTQRQEMAR